MKVESTSPTLSGKDQANLRLKDIPAEKLPRYE